MMKNILPAVNDTTRSALIYKWTESIRTIDVDNEIYLINMTNIAWQYDQFTILFHVIKTFRLISTCYTKIVLLKSTCGQNILGEM